MNRSLLFSAFRLLLVLGLLAGAAWWWQGQLAPDVFLDRAVRLQAVYVPVQRGLVPLTGGTRRAMGLPAGRPGARFELTVPGEHPVLRFAQATLQGLPDVSVRLTRADGSRSEQASMPASEAAWAIERVALEADPGEQIELEIVGLDGRGRPGLGEVLLADVVLESDGRPVDENQARIEVDSVVADLLSGTALAQKNAPPTAESEQVGLPGPLGLPLSSVVGLSLAVDRVPAGATLNLALHVGRTHDGPLVPTRVKLFLDHAPLPAADLRVDEAADPPGDEPAWHELLLSLDLAEYVGRPLPVRLELEGGDNLAVLLVEATVLRRSTQPRRPFDPERGVNLLLVVVEGLRADRLGVYGDTRAHTPVIDGLAARGLRYERVLAPSSWGLPNLASLFTGLSPVAHGIGLMEQRVLSPRVTTLARSAGWAGLMSALLHSSRLPLEESGLVEGFGTVRRELVGAPVLVESAIDWLADAEQFQWFLTLVLSDPLWPHEPEAVDLAVCDPRPDPELLDRLRALDSRPGAAEAVAQELGLMYDAEVARVDRALGLLLDHLARRGLLERTVVAVVGAYGQEFYEHGGRGQGQTLFDELLRLPLIVAGPGVVRPEDAPVVVSQPVPLADVTHLLGHVGRVMSTGSLPDRVPPPFGPDRPGLTLHSLLEPFAGVTERRLAASRRDDLLLVRDLLTGSRQLFELSSDPLAQHDLLAGDWTGDGAQDPRRAQADSLSAAYRAFTAEQLGAAPARARRVSP